MDSISDCSELSKVLRYVVVTTGEEWRILPRALARENASAGTPVLAILAAGVPASLLACVCPLWLLVQVMCVGPLVDHAFIAATVIHRRYQPHIPVRTKNAAGQLLPAYLFLFCCFRKFIYLNAMQCHLRLPVVLYGCETWSATLREECRFGCLRTGC
jgi:amino acid transporter